VAGEHGCAGGGGGSLGEPAKTADHQGMAAIADLQPLPAAYLYLCIHDIQYMHDTHIQYMHDIHVHVYIHIYIHTYIYIYIYT